MSSHDKGQVPEEPSNENKTDFSVDISADKSSLFGLDLGPEFALSSMDAELDDAPSSSTKRLQEENEADIAREDPFDNPRKRSKPNPTHKQLKNYIAHQSRLAGIAAEIDKNKREKLAKKEVAADKKTMATDKGRRYSKNSKKDANDFDFSPAARAKAVAGTKKASKELVKRVTTSSQGYNTIDTGNVFEDIYAALEDDKLIMMDDKKVDAVKQLIAALPPENPRFANLKKEYLLKATIELGQRKIIPDDHGGWALKGLKTSLAYHQVLETAWMRTRETGADEPLGGVVVDKIGNGKAVQLLACIVSNLPPPNAKAKGTLLVVPDKYGKQWATEINQHVEQDTLGPFIAHYGNDKLQGFGTAQVHANRRDYSNHVFGSGTVLPQI
jgi:hypothetical protein